MINLKIKGITIAKIDHERGRVYVLSPFYQRIKDKYKDRYSSFMSVTKF